MEKNRLVYNYLAYTEKIVPPPPKKKKKKREKGKRGLSRFCSGTDLSDGHGAEDVDEDEGAVEVVVTHQVPVRQVLQDADGHEGQLGHDATVKTGEKRNVCVKRYRIMNE